MLGKFIILLNCHNTRQWRRQDRRQLRRCLQCRGSPSDVCFWSPDDCWRRWR